MLQSAPHILYVPGEAAVTSLSDSDLVELFLPHFHNISLDLLWFRSPSHLLVGVQSLSAAAKFKGSKFDASF